MKAFLKMLQIFSLLFSENLNCEEPPVDDFEVFNEGAYDEVYETNDVVNDAFVAATDSDGELELPVPNSVANTDTRPGEEYDEPWEWGCPKQNQLMHLRPGGQVKTSISRSNSVARNSEAGSLVDNDPEPTEDVEAMTGRQRHIYETAFDSTVKADNDNDMEIVNHPILMRNEILPEGGVASSSKSSTPKGTPGGTPNLVSRVVSSRDAGIHEGDYTPKERRKVTLIRDSLRGRGGGSGSALMGDSTSSSSTSSPSSSSSKSSAAQHRTEHRVQAIVHLPPRSANSTPTLSYRAKEGLDSCASSAKSTPTHFLSSKTQHQHHLPVRQLSDLTLGENKNMSLNKSTTSMPLTTVGRSGGIHCDRRLPNTGTVSSEESVASTSSSSSSSNNNSRGSRGSVDNHRELKLVQALHAENQKASGKFSQLQKQFHELQMDRNHKPTSLSGDGVDTTTDTRPSEDYDPPWDCPKLTKRPVFSDNNSDVLVKLKFSRPSLGELTSSVEQTSTEVEKPGESTDQTWASKEIPLEPCNMTTTPDFQLPLKPGISL